MGQFVGCRRRHWRSVRGRSIFPIVSGNVSLYNETMGSDSADAGDRRRRAHRGRGEGGDHRLQGGRRHRSADWRGAGAGSGGRLGSRDLRTEEGAPPPVDLAAERRNGEFVLAPDSRRRADGGARSSPTAASASPWRKWRSPETSAPSSTAPPPKAPLHGFLFGEDQGRYVVTARAAEAARNHRRRSAAAASR